MIRFIIAAMMSVMLAWGALAQPAPAALPFPGEDSSVLPKKLALLIGVRFYNDTQRLGLVELPDIERDIATMRALLPKLGFEVTQAAVPEDANKYVTRNKILAKLKDFKRDIVRAKQDTGRAPIVLVYFAGHGLNLDSRSYLLPSDFAPVDAEGVPASAVNLVDDVVGVLSGAEPALQVIIADSCRTAVPPTLPRRLGGQSASTRSGLVNPVDGSDYLKGQFGKNRVVFLHAAIQGNAAIANIETGGRFTQALDKVLSGYYDAVRSGADPSAMSAMFDDVKSRMQNDSAPQIPEFDNRYGQKFVPFPSKSYFTAEVEAFKLWLPDNEGRREKRACAAMDLLSKFSEFSYTSPKLFDEIPAVPPTTARCTELAQGGSAGGVSRDANGRLRVSMQGDLDSTRRSVGEANPPWRLNRVQLAQAVISKTTTGDLKVDGENPLLLEALPGPDVPLDEVVVALKSSNIRASANGKSLTKVSAGDLMHAVGRTPDGSWIQVKFGNTAGYIAQSLVESAVVNLVHTIKFQPKSSELDDAAKADLARAFGSIGGVILLEGFIDYPKSDDLITVRRVSAALAAMQELTNLRRAADSVRSFIMPVASDDKALASDSMRVRVRAFPLDRDARLGFATAKAATDKIISLDVVKAVDTETGVAAPTTVQACRADLGKCSIVEGGASSAIAKSVSENLKNTDRILLDALRGSAIKPFVRY